MTRSLQPEAAADAEMREELLRRFPSLADDEPALNDTLDGVSNLPDRCRAVIVSALEDEALAEMLAGRVKAYGNRKLRLAERAQHKRAIVQAAMEAAGRKRFDFPEATLSISKGVAKVVITDESALVDPYVRVKREPDKKLIGDDLKAGLAVEGATLSNPMPVLHVSES